MLLHACLPAPASCGLEDIVKTEQMANSIVKIKINEQYTIVKIKSTNQPLIKTKQMANSTTSMQMYSKINITIVIVIKYILLMIQKRTLQDKHVTNKTLRASMRPACRPGHVRLLLCKYEIYISYGLCFLKIYIVSGYSLFALDNQNN